MTLAEHRATVLTDAIVMMIATMREPQQPISNIEGARKNLVGTIETIYRELTEHYSGQAGPLGKA